MLILLKGSEKKICIKTTTVILFRKAVTLGKKVNDRRQIYAQYGKGENMVTITNILLTLINLKIETAEKLTDKKPTLVAWAGLSGSHCSSRPFCLNF